MATLHIGNPVMAASKDRQNANIIQTIRMYVDHSQRDWHMILPVALMAQTSSSNLEPFKMFLGCEMRLPFNVELIPRDNLGPEAKIHMENLLVRTISRNSQRQF